MIRIFFIISFAFITYAMIDMCLQSGFNLKNVLLTIVALIFVVIGLFWIYSLGVIFDYKNNKFKLILGLTNRSKYERPLSSISSIDIINDLNIGAKFIINYYDGNKEEIYYHFYRISFVEQIQFKRLKMEIQKTRFL